MSFSSVLSQGLTTGQQQLKFFAGLESFWSNFEIVFGLNYDRGLAEEIRGQWHRGDFRGLPPIEVLNGEILGSAQGAYAQQTNRIYLSDRLLMTASVEAISAVIIEEIGHWVDAQVNREDTPGDEGEFFAKAIAKVGQNKILIDYSPNIIGQRYCDRLHQHQ